MTLNEIMEFDHVIRVTDDLRAVSEPRICAPETMGMEIQGDGWEWMDGYSGQDRYSGPHMHQSEFIGGRMEVDIANTPGIYVAVVVGCDHDPDYCDSGPGGECATPTEWGVLRKVAA